MLVLFFFNDPATTEICTFPYTTLFRSVPFSGQKLPCFVLRLHDTPPEGVKRVLEVAGCFEAEPVFPEELLKFLRSEEHTSELQSRQYLVCRLLLEKKNATACML